MLKKYQPFFFIFLAVSAIPGAIFFLFPNAASNINSGDIPSTSPVLSQSKTSQWEKQTPDYLVRLKAQSPQLKAGKLQFQLEVFDRSTGGPWQGEPKVFLKTGTEQETSIPIQAGDNGKFELAAHIFAPGEQQVTIQFSPAKKVAFSFYVST